MATPNQDIHVNTATAALNKHVSTAAALSDAFFVSTGALGNKDSSAKVRAALTSDSFMCVREAFVSVSFIYLFILFFFYFFFFLPRSHCADVDLRERLSVRW